MRVVLSDNNGKSKSQTVTSKDKNNGALVVNTNKNPYIFYIVGFIVLVILGVIFYIYGYQYRRHNDSINYEKSISSDVVEEIKADVEVEKKDEVEVLLEKIGELIDLPNETPTIARIDDVTKVADQPFFVNAANGDIVLFYTSAEKAILYRPSTHKIIEVSSIVLE